MLILWDIAMIAESTGYLGTCVYPEMHHELSDADAQKALRVERTMQEEGGCPLGALNSMPENQTGSLGFRLEFAFTLKDLNGLMEHLYGAENLYQSPALA